MVNIPLSCPQRKLYTDLVSIIDCLLLEQKNYQTCVVTKKTHGVDLSRAKLSVYRIVGIYKGRQTDRQTDIWLLWDFHLSVAKQSYFLQMQATVNIQTKRPE